MASIPYSILLSKDPNIISLSTIQEHQKFCYKFIKELQIFEKHKNNSKSKLIFLNNNVILFNQKKQNQSEILSWFNSLKENEKLTIMSIKNEWLINIFTQLFFIYNKVGNFSYKTIGEMEIFFNEQKKYYSKDETNITLFEELKSKNISFESELIIDKRNNKKDLNNQPLNNELNLYNQFFESKEILDKDDLKSEKKREGKKIYR